MLLIADAPGGFEAAIEAADGRLLRRVAWADAAAALPQCATLPLLILEAIGVAPAMLDAVLPEIEAYLQAHNVPTVVALDQDQIDEVTRHLLGSHITLLLAPSLEQRVSALVATTDRPIPTLHNPNPWPSANGKVKQPSSAAFQHRPGKDEDRFRALEEGMSEIDRIVSNLRRTVFAGTDVADRRPGYEAEAPSSTHPLRAQDVRRMIALRRARGKFFGHFSGEMLFEDPAWDMLLDLFAAELENTRVSVSSLCIAAGVAPTTALRWIAKMTEMELFVRDPDPVDRRRAFMTLSPRASEAMRGYMHEARKITARG